MISFQRKLRNTDGNLPGFATLRGLFIIALVALQSVEVSISYGSLLATPLWILTIALPSAIFALAGFVLAISALRTTPKIFAQRRGMELLPLALVAIIFAAVAIGPAATAVSLRSYFSDTDFWLFGVNALGVGQARLPGLFEFNNEPWTVGANYWMIPVTGAGCVLALLASRPHWRLTTLIGASVLLFVGAMIALFAGGSGFESGAGAFIGGEALSATACFVTAAAAAHFQRHIPFSLGMAVAAATALAGMAYVGNIRWQGSGLFDLAVALPITYLTLFVASQRLPLSRLARQLWPALSGLPVFAFAIQQFWIAKGSAQQFAGLNLALTLPPAMLLSYAVHYVVRRKVVLRWFPDLVGMRAPSTASPRLPIDWKGELRRRLSPQALARQFQTLVPQLLTAIVFVIVVLGLMALMLLAMQRDEAGI